MVLEEVFTNFGSSLLFKISLILLLATILSIIAKLLKQPSILAYIITGILLGPLFLNIATPTETIHLFAEIGIAFLLFLIGLNLNFSTLKRTGKSSIIIGILQIIVTTFFSYLLSKALGFSNVESLYISLAITFSSTVIIVKLLSDKNDIDTLYGKILVGLLLVQDLNPIISLIFITSLSNGIFNIISSSQEILFISSIATKS